MAWGARRRNDPLSVRERLSRMGREAAKRRGHDLRRFEFEDWRSTPGAYLGSAVCKKCGAAVRLDTSAGAGVTGAAVDSDCVVAP